VLAVHNSGIYILCILMLVKCKHYNIDVIHRTFSIPLRQGLFCEIKNQSVFTSPTQQKQKSLCGWGSDVSSINDDCQTEMFFDLVESAESSNKGKKSRLTI
jgi:hypothetical protein